MTDLVATINNIQQRIDKIIELDEKGILERKELYAFKPAIETEIRAFIDQAGDDSQRLFKKITSGWTNMPKPGYTTAGEAKAHLKDFIDLLSSIIKDTTGKDFAKEVYVPAGRVFDGRQYIQSILNKATQEVFIVDAYLSKDILPLLASKVENLATFSLKFLIGSKNKQKFDGFSADLPIFAKQYPLIKIECKTHNDLHDRFIVIDNTDVYTVGSSFDAVGQKGNSITQLTDQTSVIKHKDDMDLLWNSATLVTAP